MTIPGAELIAVERRRQIEVEGYDADHDRQHDDRRLYRAAMAYRSGDPRDWPFDPPSFKPKDELRNLIRAGALFQAAADVAAADVGEHAYFRQRAIEERDRCAALIDELLATVAEILRENDRG